MPPCSVPKPSTRVTTQSRCLAGLLDRAANESAGVSKELRHGVRRSVELLANAVVHDVRYRQKGAWTTDRPGAADPRVPPLPLPHHRPPVRRGSTRVRDPACRRPRLPGRLQPGPPEGHRPHRPPRRPGPRGSTHIQQSLAAAFPGGQRRLRARCRSGYRRRGLIVPRAWLGAVCRGRPVRCSTEHASPTRPSSRCWPTSASPGSRRAGPASPSATPLSVSTSSVRSTKASWPTRASLPPKSSSRSTTTVIPTTALGSIPVSGADEFTDEVFLKEIGPDGQRRRVVYHEGDFVFRLSGRDRQRSASYYTPEVLTEFTVRHTLDAYWEEHPDLTCRGDPEAHGMRTCTGKRRIPQRSDQPTRGSLPQSRPGRAERDDRRRLLSTGTPKSQSPLRH